MLSVARVEVGLWLIGVGFVGFIVTRVLAAVVMGMQVSRSGEAWREAGFESHQGVTMAGREARTMIAAPGAQSGPETRVKRA